MAKKKKNDIVADGLGQSKSQPLQAALSTVVGSARAKFDESVDISIVLGIDPTRGEQVVRGSALLPHGTGKKVRILVFTRGDNEEIAKAAGADYVGLEDLIEKIEGGWVDFEAALATPDVMAMIGKVARVLGPRGLLPNKRAGTVVDDLKTAINELKQGRVSFRNDKGGVTHVPIGKVSFGVEKLQENFLRVLKAVQQSKPATSKGKFIKKVVVSSTMGAGFVVDVDKLLN